MPKVSICIPAYQNRDGVERLLDSIEQQRYKDYEVIITDDSEEDCLEALITQNPDIRYHKNEKRLGSTANWNAAIKMSRGSYVKMMHHDDWLTDSDSLGAFVDMMEENPDAVLAFSGTRQVSGGHFTARHIREEDVGLIREDYRNLFLGNTIGAPSAVMVRKCALLYDEQLKWLVDMEYYMQLFSKNPVFVYTKAPLISIGVSQEQLTERCRDDSLVNTAEYGYIFAKYDLGKEKRYRDKLIRIFTDFEMKYQQIKPYGISAGEYQAALMKKLGSKIKWKLTHETPR